MKVNSVDALVITTNQASDETWGGTVYVIRTGAAACDMHGFPSGGQTVSDPQINLASTPDWTTAIDFDVVGQSDGGSASDVTCEFSFVELLP